MEKIVSVLSWTQQKLNQKHQIRHCKKNPKIEAS